MKEFKNIEMSLTSDGHIQYSTPEGTKIYNQNDYDFTDVAMSWLNENYPDAVKQLDRKFAASKANVPFHNWQIVTNFFACKCGAIDPVIDIDAESNLHSEFMNCPIRLFCKDKICELQPKYKLTTSESEIIPLLAQGLSQKEISDMLDKNQETVKSTICRACKRFGLPVNSKVLIAYCNKKGLLWK